jgi:hypothetical protein
MAPVNVNLSGKQQNSANRVPRKGVFGAFDNFKILIIPYSFSDNSKACGDFRSTNSISVMLGGTPNIYTVSGVTLTELFVSK